MKTVIHISLILVLAVVLHACTEVLGDGMNTVIWKGSTVPQDSCFRNPVWEPDLSYPAVFKAAVGYYAIGADKEWSPGLHYRTPVLSSSDLMRWDLRGEALEEAPAWAEGPVVGISAGFAKTKATYFLFYEIEGAGIGQAASKAPQGPFGDFGKLLDPASIGTAMCSNPFFFVYGSKAYLFFQGGDGMYGQELRLNKTSLASLVGEAFKVTGPAINSMYMTKIEDYYYLLGGVDDGDQSRITLGRSDVVKGPFLSKDGSSLLDSEGTTLLTGDPENGITAVSHPAGIFADGSERLWVLSQTIDIDMPQLENGDPRYPLCLTSVELDGEGWPAETFMVAGGWNHPKFAK